MNCNNNFFKDAIINYLDNLLLDIKNNNITEKKIEDIYKLIYYKNCEIKEIMESYNDVLNYTFFGWYILNHEKLFSEKENISN